MMTGTYSVASLTLQGTASLDVTNSTLFIDYAGSADPLATIQSYIVSGYNGGTWNGHGIFSSSVAAANTAGGEYGIGYADGADGIVTGLSSGQIEIMPTLLGDAALTGTVAFGDFQLLAGSFGQSAGWDMGNFSYGSIVNFGDFQLLAGNFGKTSSLSAEATIQPTVAAASLIATPASSIFDNIPTQTSDDVFATPLLQLSSNVLDFFDLPINSPA